MKKMTVDEQKQVSLEILKYVTDFCDAHNLRYYLWGGTLLGAIRHNGYIPWDDDVDIIMPRKDYESFMKSFSSEHYVAFCCEKDDRYPFVHGKVIDNRTIKNEPVYFGRGLEMGIDIDVFPVDMLGDTAFMEQSLKKRNRLIRYLFVASHKMKKGQSIKHLLLLWAFLLHGRGNGFSQTINKMAQSFSENASMQMLYADSNIKYPLIMENAWLDNREKHVFESYEFYIPSGWDCILKRCYGDYMTPPPKEKQVTHHLFDAFWR